MISFQGNFVQAAKCLSCRCVPKQGTLEASKDDPYLPVKEEAVVTFDDRGIVAVEGAKYFVRQMLRVDVDSFKRAWPTRGR